MNILDCIGCKYLKKVVTQDKQSFRGCTKEPWEGKKVNEIEYCEDYTAKEDSIGKSK